ncbi:MAG TPA: hypothetical protein VFD69_21950 [Vicinamibacterales bacterium]|nr:hypothetical protein [Vicinamibacterales bacterium]
MTRRICEHEPAVTQVVLSRRWPDGCEQELRAHAEACEECREVVAIAALLREDYDHAREAIGRRDVPLPSAGQIWWRAAVHARAEAVQAAARPLVWGYGVAAACLIGLLVAGIGVMWPSVLPAFDRVGALTARFAPTADMVLATLRAQMPIVIGVAACLIAAPIALYYALREE